MAKFVITHESSFRGIKRLSYWARIPSHGWAHDLTGAQVWKTMRGAEAALNKNMHLMSGVFYVQEIT